MTGRTAGGLALLAACVLTAAATPASERRHTVRKGESASAIAKRYYGDYAVADLLLLFNGRSDSVIRPGEALRVPVCDVHTVRSGDSWSRLAQRYLERPAAYSEIAALNGIDPDRPLRVGQRITIPVILTHELRPGESLGALARRFYGGPELVPVLQSFNGVDDPRRLSVGQTLEIPLLAFRAAEDRATVPTPEPAIPPSPKTKPESAVAAARPTEPIPEPEPAPRFAPQIQVAADAFANDDYVGARDLLERLRERVTTQGVDEDQAELLRLLALVYVAFDHPEKACAAHRSRTRLVGKTPLDPDLVSPKIRETLERCGG
jgi:LysM repeat protein